MKKFTKNWGWSSKGPSGYRASNLHGELHNNFCLKKWGQYSLITVEQNKWFLANFLSL